MTQHRLSSGALLDESGALCEAGYATSLVKTYARGKIRAGGLRIKEWDYYLIYNDRYGVALTIDDNSYMGLISASFLDFETRAEKTVSPMYFFPMGKVGFPPSSESGDVKKSVSGARAEFINHDGIRRLQVSIDQFDDGPFSCDFTLTDAPRDSMVIATPFAGKKTAFYYNQKIVGMRASGTATCRGKTYAFDAADTFGLLDWGRGVWTYDNTWYWGAGQGLVNGHVVGFNIGYGFGDTAAASENMVFVDGVAHKLDRLTFNIPKKADGTDDYLSPWTFSSNDGRFEMRYTPILDRKARTSVGPLLSDQHQVFGYFDGTILLDGGETLTLTHFLGFAEKVRNKW